MDVAAGNVSGVLISRTGKATGSRSLMGSLRDCVMPWLRSLQHSIVLRFLPVVRGLHVFDSPTVVETGDHPAHDPLVLLAIYCEQLEISKVLLVVGASFDDGSCAWPYQEMRDANVRISKQLRMVCPTE